MSDDGILKFSNAGGVSSVTRYPNFLTNYGDFGAMQRIASSTLTSNGYFVFNNIPTIFQDLKLVCSLRDTNGSGSVGVMYFKEGVYGYSSSDYSDGYLYGTGSTITSFRNINRGRFEFDTTISTASSGIYSSYTFEILNYANTSTYKTMLMRGASDANGSGNTELVAGLWRKTDAITQIGIYTSSGGSHWASGSTATLYGVKASNA